MKKATFALLVFVALFVATADGARVEYDAIMVRSDLPYDWTVAQAYSQRARIPIITTSPNTLDESTRKQLLGFKEAGQNNILVFGGEAAISPIVEAEMVDEGFVTHRIREVDRYGTSARVAVELYEHADTVVIVSGEGVDGLLNAQKAAFRTEAPILFVKNDGIPQSVNEALQLLETKEVILIPSGVSEKVKEELETVSKVKVFPQDSYVFSGTRGQRIFDITLGLVLGALLFLLLKRERKEKVPYNVLTEDEERIIKAIEEKGGEIGQDALYEKTGFSRPKISRVVSELVERDLLEKTQFKRTFKLKIKKELVKD